MDGARPTVALPGGITFASAVSASSIERVTNPALAGLSISGVTGGVPGSSATLTLATDGRRSKLPAVQANRQAAER